MKKTTADEHVNDSRSFNSKTKIASKHDCVIWLQANSLLFCHESLLFSVI